MNQSIKIQVRDNSGNLLAYHNDCKTLEKALEFKRIWEVVYANSYKTININFFNNK